MLKKWFCAGLFLPLFVFGCTSGEKVDGGQAQTQAAVVEGQKPPAVVRAQKPPAYQGKVTILTYHHLVPREYSDPKNPAEVTVEDFRDQLDYLKSAGYNTVSLGEYLAYLHGQGDLPAKPVLITFDDGYASNYYRAFPLLRERGMKAAIFVVVNWIPYEDPPDNPRKANMLSWGQLKEMLKSGVFEVQSHTYDSHYTIGKGYALTQPRIKGDGKTESREEFLARVRKDLAESKGMIEAVTGYPVFAFAFPWGAYTEETLGMIRDAGYGLAVTTRQGSNEPGVNSLTLMRKGIGNGDGLKGFKEKLEGK